MPATSYLTYNSFLARTVAPSAVLSEVENAYPNWILAQLLTYSAQIDARLAKRYAVPFSSVSPPEMVCNWLARLVTPRVYYKRGVDPADKQIDDLVQDAARVLEELKEAADAENGLYDLPLRADADGSGISKTRVLWRADQDAYTWTDRQAFLASFPQRSGFSGR